MRHQTLIEFQWDSGNSIPSASLKIPAFVIWICRVAGLGLGFFFPLCELVLTGLIQNPLKSMAGIRGARWSHTMRTIGGGGKSRRSRAGRPTAHSDWALHHDGWAAGPDVRGAGIPVQQCARPLTQSWPRPFHHEGGAAGPNLSGQCGGQHYFFLLLPWGQLL